MKRVLILIIFSVFFLSANCFAKENNLFDPSEATESIRNRKTYGFDLGIGQPFLSFFGGMVGINLGDLFRVSAGGGTSIYWATYQANLKVFTSDSNFAWFFGGGLTYLNGTPGDFLGNYLNVESVVTPHIETGLDYTSEIGFHLNANIGIAIPDSKIIVYPGLAFGWYF